MAQTATVKFVPLRNDLANLPNSLAALLFSANVPAQLAVIEIQTKQGPVFCGWTGLSSANASHIELDPTFASNLGLQHGMEVRLAVKPRVPEAHSVLLEPATVGDWEIVETHVAFLEAFMINQVRAVALNKPVTVFPSSTSLAVLKVVRIDPDIGSAPVARLHPECEVIIAPRTRETADQSEKRVHVPDTRRTISAIRRATVHPFLPGLDSCSLEVHGTIAGLHSGEKVSVCLAIPATLAGPPHDNEEIPRCKSVIATYIEEPSALLGLSYGLACALGAKHIGCRVGVKSVKQSFPSISATLRPFTTTSSSRVALGTNEYINAVDLDLEIVSKGLVVAPHSSLPMGGVIDSASPEWGVVKRLKIGAETPLAESQKMPRLEASEIRRPIVGQERLLTTLETQLVDGCGALLYGSRGCGKSVVVAELAARLEHKQVRSIIFKCGNYTDKAVSTVRDALRRVSYEALWSEPSLLIFDDIDKLAPAPQDYGDSSRQQQIAEVISGTLSPLIDAGRVSVLATAQDQAAIHGFLMASHFLESVIHMRSPDKELREEILRAAIDCDPDLTAAKDLDLLEVVAETEGYQPGDLWILVERLSAILALSNGDREVTTDAALAATKDFVPASLRGVKLEKPAVKWSEIGGMFNAKQLVLETLEWPTKYAPVFANCPLRLRSGLLFYGYPGCGKTMLASAIASQTGLNFISVKGPEILNKYIGASEQSVRDLFDRAQAAKPCVLFFDEFDSIAPKRGHDATGVTDRVVNQLLTQMDGAEGLDGVYVLAATSRPDLIDSALLRPGRLDKSVLCDMPDVDARFDILQRAAGKLNIQPGLDLREIAEKTDGFSGADVQALVYNAYLKGVHATLDTSVAVQSNDISNISGFQIGVGDLENAKAYVSNDLVDRPSETALSEPQVVSIGNEEMRSALQESKPSISAHERARFQAIYSEFSTDRNGEMPPGTSSTEIGGRVTLQ